MKADEPASVTPRRCARLSQEEEEEDEEEEDAERKTRQERRWMVELLHDGSGWIMTGW